MTESSPPKEQGPGGAAMRAKDPGLRPDRPPRDRLDDRPDARPADDTGAPPTIPKPATAPPTAGPALSGRIRMETRGLNFYYGSAQALFGITLPLPRQAAHQESPRRHPGVIQPVAAILSHHPWYRG